jgi:hypothetical protein
MFAFENPRFLIKYTGKKVIVKDVKDKTYNKN